MQLIFSQFVSRFDVGPTAFGRRSSLCEAQEIELCPFLKRDLFGPRPCNRWEDISCDKWSNAILSYKYLKVNSLKKNENSCFMDVHMCVDCVDPFPHKILCG